MPGTVNWKQVFFLVILALASVFLVSIMVSLTYYLLPSRYTPEVGLTVLLVVGIVGLVIALTIVVVVLRAVGVSDNTKAFGLPAGSIRAIIALGLILVFSIMSIFLYFQVKHVGLDKIQLTNEELSDFPVERIVSSTPTEEDPNLFDVIVEAQPNEASEDIAKQLVTTTGTLIVAVAGFYFGTQAVSVAQGKQISQPVIRTINPNSGEKNKDKDVEIYVEILGKNFESPGKVVLTKDSAPDMIVTDITASATKIKGRLSISKSQEEGKYKLVVVNSDGGEDSLEDAFEVKKPPEEKPED